jgi:hypothetical protein
MPDKDGKTIQDLIYYQYAKIILGRAFGAPKEISGHQDSRATGSRTSGEQDVK